MVFKRLDVKSGLFFGGVYCSFMVLILIASVGCQDSGKVEDGWQQKERDSLLQIATDFNPDSRDLRLSVSQVVSLDENTFLLGGSYRSPAASIRSALLRSTDRGKTWVDTGVWLTGCDTWKIFVLDDKHAFAVVNWAIEGWLTPFVFFRTSDGGATWKRSEQDLPFEHPGIPGDAGFSFASPKDGHFWITGSMGKTEYYITKDGSRTWSLSYTVNNCPSDVYEPRCKFERDWKNKQIQVLCRPDDSPKYEIISVISTKYSMDEQGDITPKVVSSEIIEKGK